MSDRLEEIPDQLTEEEFNRWKSLGKINYPYGNDDYVVTLDVGGKKIHYRKSTGEKLMYYVLPEPKEELLGVCSLCERIRVDDEHNFWLDKNENPAEYDSILKQHKPTHTYCPECYEKEKKRLELD